MMNKKSQSLKKKRGEKKCWYFEPIRPAPTSATIWSNESDASVIPYILLWNILYK